MAQNGRHARVELTTTGSPGNHGRHSRVELVAYRVPQNGRHSRVELFTLPQNARHSRVELKSASPVSAGTDLVGVEPGSLVPLLGTGGDVGGTPVWSQVSGPMVVFTQTGAAASFRAPPTLTGTNVVFRFSVNGAMDDVSITVLAATHRVLWGGVECAAATYAVVA